MLLGLDGGALDAAIPRTLGEALELYASERLSSSSTQEGPGVHVGLEVLTAFFNDDHVDLVAAGGGGRRSAAGVRGLPARCLLRGLHASAHLFSFSCVVSAPVISRFAAEVRAMASWSREVGICDEASLDEFRRGFRRALFTLRRHQRLQEHLERAQRPFALSADAPMVQGRFLVEEVDALGMRAAVPESPAYRVLVPRRARHLFHRGEAVSLAMIELATGWCPVAASLPADPDWLDSRIDELSRMRWPSGAAHLTDAAP